MTLLQNVRSKLRPKSLPLRPQIVAEDRSIAVSASLIHRKYRDKLTMFLKSAPSKLKIRSWHPRLPTDVADKSTAVSPSTWARPQHREHANLHF